MLGEQSTDRYLHLSIFLYNYSRNNKIIVEELKVKMWSNSDELDILPCYLRVSEMLKLIIHDQSSQFIQKGTKA